MAELLVLAGVLIGVFLGLFLLKKVIKLVLFVLIILILSVSVFGYMAYQDGKELVETFEEGEIVYMMVEDSEVVLGLSVDMKEDEFDAFEDISVSEDFFVSENYDEVIEDEDLLILMEKDDYEDLLGDEVNIRGELVMKKDEVLLMMESERLIEDYVEEDNFIFDSEERAFIKEDLIEENSLETDEELKAVLFFLSLESHFEDGDFVGEFMRLYKEDKVIVYPEGFLLPFIKKLPFGF